MNEIQLKYGCNPNQKPSRIFMEDGSDLPVKVLNGRPGYINFLDAFNGWQLVKELKAATGLPAATSFKHVSPAGAAVGKELDDTLAKIYWVDDLGKLSPLASAYARARGADRMSSFGDFIALSDICDIDTANLIKREVSDGVIAPGFTDEAFEILKTKKKGNYNIIQIDPDYVPAELERKQVYGITFEQSRIHCTRLAGQKADNWYLRQSPQVMGLQFKDEIGRAERDNAIDVYIGDEYMDVLAEGEWQKIFKVKPEVFTIEAKRAWLDKMTDVILGSDAFFPFPDNIERAHKSGVKYIAQPGGSVRDEAVIECCDKYDIAMAFTGIRLFHH